MFRDASGDPDPPGENITDFAIKPIDVGEGGLSYTDGCRGCRDIQLGRPPKGHHSALCRRRVEAHLLSTEEGRRRLEARDRRIEGMLMRLAERAARAQPKESPEGDQEAAGTDGEE